MAEILLEHLHKRYDNGARAVDDLSLAVADGELVVLVGPSGCGKTTILRLLAGLEESTTGRILLDGRDVTRRPPRDRDVALVAQRPTVYPHLSVADNLAFGARLREGGLFHRPLDLADRAVQAARLLGLTDLLGRRADQLSGGQQQRVALGRAIVRRPAVFLLDEPLNSLDPAQRHELRRELHLLQRRLRATMLYATHDPVEALTLGDRVVVLDGGRVRQVGPPGELYRRPADRFVAGFFGWPPMNFLDGRLGCDPGGGVFFESAAGRWSVPGAAIEGAGDVTLGIRPESVRVGRDGPARLVLDILLVESLGATMLVTLGRDGRQLSALTDGRTPPAEGQAVEVTFDMNAVHLFDRTTGRARGHGARDG